MLDRLSTSAMMALASMGGASIGADPIANSGIPTAAGPTLVMLKDPLQDVEALVDQLDANTGRRPPNTWLQKHRGGLGSGSHRAPTYDGRRCCLSTIEGIQRRLQHLPIPTPVFRCEGCGAEFRVEMRTREERRHA